MSTTRRPLSVSAYPARLCPSTSAWPPAVFNAAVAGDGDAIAAAMQQGY
jgi:hypothetical protein